MPQSVNQSFTLKSTGDFDLECTIYKRHISLYRPHRMNPPLQLVL